MLKAEKNINIKYQDNGVEVHFLNIQNAYL